MYSVLVADDDYEDRELLRIEIQRALEGLEPNLKFYEARSISQASERLRSQHFDLLTLDVEFDRMNEGIDALPVFFESYPTLSIIVISGKLNKTEVSERLFHFTKDNVLKGKRWARHFDVLDKKDDKAEAVRRAYEFSVRQKEAAEGLKELFLLAEGYMEKGEVEKCLEVYQKIQGLAPGEHESGENIKLFKKGASFEQALEYLRKGEKLIAALLLGHYLESRLKAFTRRGTGRVHPNLADCLSDLERAHRISPLKKGMFQGLMRIRNKCVHHPMTISEADFAYTAENLKLIEADF